MDVSFWLNSILLGAGLAADAFSVSVANGLSDPLLPHPKAAGIAGTFAAFQFAMPMIGWFCVRTIVKLFSRVQRFIPYIALILLLYIGGKMIWESLRRKPDDGQPVRVLTIRTLLVQGIATSIDALSVGFTIEAYTAPLALAAAGIVGAVTFLLCIGGIWIGKRFGARFRHSEWIGGLILIGIGIEIFVKGLLH